MKKSILATLAVSLLSISSIAIHADPIQVTVSGTTYDVAFSGGNVSCVAYAPYDGCDASSDFTFSNFSDAASALDQIVAHILANQLDFALLESVSATTVLLIVPYAFVAGPGEVDAAFNSSDNGGGFWNLIAAGNGDFGILEISLSTSYASFIPVSSVPEPATLGLLSLGLAGLGFARRRRQAQT